jgi:1,4-dihydroxy-2-naphthoate octaprenyltransferase
MPVKPWIQAFRLRTLPLALSSVGMGAFLAAAQGALRWNVLGLCCLTTVLLQILSNLANDYGDYVHGADHALRTGPRRTVQSGLIHPASMRKMIRVFTGLSLVSGLALLWVAFKTDVYNWLVFLSLGLLSIAAAITYTAGRRPYGYAGLGDVSVLIFFGFIGVGGSAYLFTLQFHEAMLWPALSCGLLATGVLNLNNLRDREADALAGKKTIPVRFGRRAGQFYHATLITGAMACAVVYVARQYVSAVQLLFLLTIPLFALNVRAVFVLEEARLDPWLRQLALSTLLFVLLFGAGQLLALP